MARPGDVPPLLPSVGDAPEPDGTQPMTAAEFRMVREYLGLSAEWLADTKLKVALRTVRRWEHGDSPVPEGVREQLELLEQYAAELVETYVGELNDASDLVFTIPEETSAMTPGWWRMIAMRVASEIPGLYVRYPPRRTCASCGATMRTRSSIEIDGATAGATLTSVCPACD